MIDVRMWARALRIIPQVEREQWQQLDIISRWLIATRAAVFVMTGVSAGIGGLLAVRDGVFSGTRFFACIVGLVFAHATNNLLNDLTDHLRGVDRDNYFRSQYGPQPLEHGLLTIRQVLHYAAVSGGIALAAGLFLVATTGFVTLQLLLAGIFFVLFYTWPLKYIGLGEPAVLLVWGPLMVGGTYHVVSGGLYHPSITWIALAYAIGPTAVLFGKHTDKLEADRAKGIHTLPVILGEPRARAVVRVMLLVQLALVVMLVLLGLLGWPLLLVLLAVPTLRETLVVYDQPRPRTRPEKFPAHIWPTYLVAYAFRYNRKFGLLFLIGLLLDVWLR